MNSSFDEKFEKLRQEYKKNLPAKINEILELWTSIEKQYSQNDMITFHRKIHSLHGSAGMYGFEALGLSAQNLEMIINTLLENPELYNEKKESIKVLLNQLKVN